MDCQHNDIIRSIYIDIEHIDPSGKFAYECERKLKNNKTLTVIFIEKIKKMFAF